MADLAEVQAPVRGARLTRWCRGTRLLVAGSLLWLGFVLAHLLFSGWWWLWLVPDAAPPLVFVVLPVLMFLVLGIALWRGVPVPRSGRWWVIGPTALALVVGAGMAGLNPGALWSEPAQAPAGAVKVMSWNTEYWDQRDDPAQFYDYLRAQHADVYLLQEYVFHADGVVDPAKANTPVDDAEKLRREFPGYTVVARGELVTLSRFPVVGQPLVGPDRVRDVDWPTEFTQAKTLRTDIDVHGRVLSVYNTHIPVQFSIETSPLSSSFYTYIRNAAGQRREQFDGLVADVTANRKPVVVAGDFNTSPSMGDLNALKSVTEDAVHANSSVYPVSWLAWRLDWAFTRDVEVHSYDFTDPRELSDHRPQWLVISLPAPQAQPPAPR